MANKNESGHWIDSAGNEIPVKYIDPHSKKRDALVEKLFKRAIKLHELMTAFRDDLETEVLGYVDDLRQSNGLSENWKGNLSLTGFSGDKQIEIDVKDLIKFDERLNIAKGLIDQYLLRRVKLTGDEQLSSLVKEAFNMDKTGQVNRYMLKRICKINIPDPDWQKAIELIRESETTIGSKQYVLFKTRPNRLGKWEPINLNFSSI